MGSSESRQAVARAYTAEAVLAVRACSSLSIADIRRLYLWFSKSVPEAFLTKDGAARTTTKPTAAAADSQSNKHTDWKSLFVASADGVSSAALDRLWAVLKQCQREILLRDVGLLDEDTLGDLLPADASFDFFDFVVLYAMAVAPPRGWDVRFALMCDDTTGKLTRESMLHFGLDASSGGEKDRAAVASAVAQFFEGAPASELAQDAFVVLSGRRRVRLVNSCFGLLDALSLHLLDATTHLTSGGPACGSLLKRGSSFAWATRVVCCDNGFLWYRKSDEDHVKRVLPLEGAAVKRVAAEAEESPSESSSFSFVVAAGSWSREFSAAHDLEREAWMHTILSNSTNPEDNAFCSFAPLRQSVHARWFVDGRDYFLAVADALEAARSEILISGWVISPHVYLRRDPPFSICNRLDMIIKRKASEGVRVFVLPWNETKVAMDLGSEFVTSRFSSLGAAVYILRHPSVFPLYWSHHQKTVVVDQQIAFIGGIDLSFGRYDSPEHRIDDPCDLCPTWPGRDYYNAEAAPFSNAHDAAASISDRTSTPRMPWHDAAVMLTGDCAADVSRNFIQRWQHHARDLEAECPLVVPRSRSDPPLEIPPSLQRGYRVDCQLVRSLGEWSGSDRTERSIEDALVHTIQHARHFVFIENQYYISLMADAGHNRVGPALLDRLRKAIHEKQMFRLIVVMPAHPEGALDAAGVHLLMKFQYESICRGHSSLIGVLADEFPDCDLGEYIVFCALRSWGTLYPGPPETTPVVQSLIYVHSKILIADDRVAVIGSANINDRSLLGDRDSELSAVIRGGDMMPITSALTGQDVLVSCFVHTLRMGLWSEHLGLTRAEDLAIISDASSHAAFDLLRRTAAANTQAFVDVFGNAVPHDEIRTLAQLDLGRWSQIPAIAPAEARARLSVVRGHLVELPLRFLEDEDLTPSPLNSESLLENRLFH